MLAEHKDTSANRPITHDKIPIMETPLYTYFIWFVTYSILGWALETIVCSINAKKFINRGFLNGPYCPIYGIGSLLCILLLSNIDNLFILFVTSLVLTCTLEYITSWLMEKLFHARWWDYSGRPLNIDGRVWIPNGLAFGAFGILIIKIIHPFLASITDQIPAKITFPPKEVITLINAQERRIIKAFPKIQSLKNNPTLQEIKKYISTKKKKPKK